MRLTLLIVSSVTEIPSLRMMSRLSFTRIVEISSFWKNGSLGSLKALSSFVLFFSSSLVLLVLRLISNSWSRVDSRFFSISDLASRSFRLISFRRSIILTSFLSLVEDDAKLFIALDDWDSKKDKNLVHAMPS